MSALITTMRVSAAEPTNRASTTAARAARGAAAVGSAGTVVDGGLMMWWSVLIVGTEQFVSTPKGSLSLHPKIELTGCRGFQTSIFGACHTGLPEHFNPRAVRRSG